jgi:uncharacterized protein DUF6520
MNYFLIYKTYNKMKKSILPALAIVVALAASAFTTNRNVNSNFFVYTSSLHTQAAVQSIGNYVSTTTSPCSGTTTNVCGVTLPTAEPVGQNPNSGDFSDESDNLWSSQQNHSPADDDINMKP